jgi:hypothetical protein
MGIFNNVMASPTNSPRRRRRPSKKAAPATMAKTAHNAQASRKRALDTYQNQLVARPAIPVSNQFTALRIMAKNSATSQLRQAWEVPKPAPRPTQVPLRHQCKSQAPTEAIYKAHRALKQRKSVRNIRSRQYVSHPDQLSQLLAQEGLHLRQHLAPSRCGFQRVPSQRNPGLKSSPARTANLILHPKAYLAA